MTANVSQMKPISVYSLPKRIQSLSRIDFVDLSIPTQLCKGTQITRKSYKKKPSRKLSIKSQNRKGRPIDWLSRKGSLRSNKCRSRYLNIIRKMSELRTKLQASERRFDSTSRFKRGLASIKRRYSTRNRQKLKNLDRNLIPKRLNYKKRWSS